MEDTTTSDQVSSALLPPKLRLALWHRVDRRLQHGAVLITTEHFYEVMKSEFRRLVKVPPSDRVKRVLREMVVTVNQEHPETYLTLGIRNAMTLYFRGLDAHMGGQTEDVLNENRKRIKELIQEGRTAFFLDSIGVEVPSRGVPPSVEKAILKIVSGEKLRAEPQVTQRARRRRISTMAPLSGGEQEAADDGPAAVNLPDDKARQERIAEMNLAEKKLSARIMERAPRHLNAFVQQDLLEEGEAKTLEELYQIDQRLTAGQIDAEEAQRQREQFDAGVRDKLQKRLRSAVDFSVCYVNAAESLKRLPVASDGALRLLVRHSGLVMAGDAETPMAAVLEELEADEETLERLARIMERREHEARMVSADLPPYRHVLGDKPIENLVIEEEFIQELRDSDRDSLADTLNSEDADLRVRLAADIRCLVALIRSAIEPTPFHRAVRRLKIHQSIRRMYSSSGDSKSGRHKVQYFVNQRLVRMYPDIDAAERAEILEESRKIMEAVDSDAEGGEQSNELRFYRT